MYVTFYILFDLQNTQVIVLLYGNFMQKLENDISISEMRSFDKIALSFASSETNVFLSYSFYVDVYIVLLK